MSVNDEWMQTEEIQKYDFGCQYEFVDDNDPKMTTEKSLNDIYLPKPSSADFGQQFISPRTSAFSQTDQNLRDQETQSDTSLRINQYCQSEKLINISTETQTSNEMNILLGNVKNQIVSTDIRKNSEKESQTDPRNQIDIGIQTNYLVNQLDKSIQTVEFEGSDAKLVNKRRERKIKKPDRSSLNLDLKNNASKPEFVIVDWKDFEKVIQERHKTNSLNVQKTPVSSVSSQSSIQLVAKSTQVDFSTTTEVNILSKINDAIFENRNQFMNDESQLQLEKVFYNFMVTSQSGFVIILIIILILKFFI